MAGNPGDLVGQRSEPADQWRAVVAGGLTVSAWLAGVAHLEVGGEAHELDPAVYAFGMFLSMVALAVVHELGHALAARLTGTGLYGVRIGGGTRLLSFTVGRTWVDLHLPLVGGAVYSGGSTSRVKMIMVLAAGVVAEAVAIIAVAPWQPDAALLRSIRFGVVALGAASIVINLMPRTLHDSRRGVLRSDGAQIRDVLAGRHPSSEDGVTGEEARNAILVVRLLAHGRTTEAVRLSAEMFRHDPANELARRLYGNALVSDQQWSGAVEVLAPLLHDDDPVEDAERATTANNAAFAAVMTFDRRFQQDALAWSALAIDFDATNLAYRHTRGAALAMSGEPDAGLDLLRAVTADKLAQPPHRAFATGFAALVAIASGDPTAARQRFHTMYALDDECPLRDRIAQLLGPHEMLAFAELLDGSEELPESAAPDESLGLTARVALAHVDGNFGNEPLDDHLVVHRGDRDVTVADIRRHAKMLLERSLPRG